MDQDYPPKNSIKTKICFTRRNNDLAFNNDVDFILLYACFIKKLQETFIIHISKNVWHIANKNQLK